MNQLQKSVGEEFNKLKEYLYSNRWLLTIFYFIFILVYLPWMVNPSLRIDGEILINNPGYMAGYLERGQGNLLTEYVFGVRWFNPLFLCVFGFVLLICSGILFGYISYRTGINSRVSTVFGLACFTYPIMIELIYFDMLFFKASWAYFLTFLAVGLALKNGDKINIVYRLISVICLFWAISTYEAFAAVYISAIVFCFFTLCYKWIIVEKKDVKFKELFIIVINSIIVLLLSMILNTLITKIFNHTDNEYLESKFYWNQRPIMESIRAICAVIRKGLLGHSVYYTYFMGIIFILVLVLIFIPTIKMKFKKNSWVFLCSGLFLQLCPYLMTIALGGYGDVVRAQLSYPFVIAANILFLMNLNTEKNIARYILILLCCCSIWVNLKTTMRLEYTDNIRAREDLRVAEDIYSRIGKVSKTTQEPVLIVGRYDNKLNEACIRGEMIGTSIFGYADFQVPRYVYSSTRTFELLKTFGMSRNVLMDDEMLIEARKKALNMPLYPQEGCVKNEGDYIVVNLSKDDFMIDIIDGEVGGLHIIDEAQKTKGRLEIESSVVEKDNVILTGWGFCKKVNTNESNKLVFIYDDNDNYYYLTTLSVEREDIPYIFKNEEYRNSGFQCKAPLDSLPENYSKMKIGIMYQLSDGSYVYYKSNKKFRVKK